MYSIQGVPKNPKGIEINWAFFHWNALIKSRPIVWNPTIAFLFFKILVEKSELFCSDISKTLDDIRRVKQQFLESNSERVRNCMKENALLQKENNDLKNNLMELETKLGEQQKENNVLKEQVAKQQDEKQTLLNEVHSMKNTMHEKLEERYFG